MIKCVVFDVDGVLIKHEYFTKQLEDTYGISHTKVQPFFENEFLACLTGQADLKKVIKPYLQKWDFPGSVDEFLDFWFAAEHNVNKAVIEFVKILKDQDITLAVATNQERYRTKYLKKEMQLDELFDVVVSSCDAHALKPDQQFYSYLHNSLESITALNPTEVVFVDDSKKNVTGARTFGYHAIHFTSYQSFIQELNLHLASRTWS